MSYIYWFVLVVVFVMGKIAETNPICSIGRNNNYEIRPDTGAFIILSVTLILVAGLRYRVGADYMSYFNWEVTSWGQVWGKILQFKEGGFSLLALISRTIINHGQSIIFFSSLITVGLFCRTIYKYHTMFLVSMLLYIFLGLWQESFNAVRQCMASAIVFAGHRFILTKKPWRYFLVVFCAAMFHASALVMIMPYFLFNRKADMKQIILLTIGAIILRFSYDIIFTVIEEYKGRALLGTAAFYSREVNGFRVAVAFIPIVLYILLCRKDNQTEEQNFYVNALLFNAFAMLAGMGSAYFGRIGLYTNAAVTIGYGHLLQLIDDERTRKVVLFVIMIVFSLYWLYSIIVAGSTIRDYHWIFNAEV